MSQRPPTRRRRGTAIQVYGADIERLGSSIDRRFDDWPVREPALREAA